MPREEEGVEEVLAIFTLPFVEDERVGGLAKREGEHEEVRLHLLLSLRVHRLRRWR